MMRKATAGSGVVPGGVIVFAEGVAGIDNVRMCAVGLHGGKLRLQGFDDGTSAEIAAPDADYHEEGGTVGEPLDVGFDVVDNLGGEGFR